MLKTMLDNPAQRPALSVRELADELGSSPKTMRAWMRREGWRSLVEHGQPWLLNPEQADRLRAQFGDAPKTQTLTGSQGDDPLPHLSVGELLTNYRHVLGALRSRGLVRTNNAPIGDLAEYCAAMVYDGLLAPNSEKSYDLVAEDDRRIQVKVRVIRPGTHPSATFSPIRSFDFDACLFLLVDDEAGDVELAREFNAEQVRKFGRHREHTNGVVLRIGQVRGLSDGVDLTTEFRDSWRGILERRG